METREPSAEFAQELTAINQEIQEQRELQSQESAPEGNAQLARSALSGAIHQAAGTKPTGTPVSNQTASYLDTVDPETSATINTLIDKIHQKGLATAIAEAREESSYILDVFHDALVEKLYTELTTHNLL